MASETDRVCDEKQEPDPVSDDKKYVFVWKHYFDEAEKGMCDHCRFREAERIKIAGCAETASYDGVCCVTYVCKNGCVCVQCHTPIYKFRGKIVYGNAMCNECLTRNKVPSEVQKDMGQLWYGKSLGAYYRWHEYSCAKDYQSSDE